MTRVDFNIHEFNLYWHCNGTSNDRAVNLYNIVNIGLSNIGLLSASRTDNMAASHSSKNEYTF